MRHLILRHRWAIARELAAAVPQCALFLLLRFITILPGTLGVLLLALPWPRSILPVRLIEYTRLLPAALVAVDMVVSERSTKLRETLVDRSLNIRARRLRTALANDAGFVVFLRDFRPQDSETFTYKAVVGAIREYSHRDEYLFAGVEVVSLPIVSITIPLGGAPTNRSFEHLRLPSTSWLVDLSALVHAARSIVVAVPVGGHLARLMLSRDLQDAQAVLAEFSRMPESEPGAHGLAAELNLILKSASLRDKTLLVNAFVDGQPYVTSTWRSLRDFTEITSADVGSLLEETGARL